jgi:YgiT-type zinc finger domain-containing protein
MREIVMKETMIETQVTYTIAHQGKVYIIEKVPARVCKKTGEEYFSPETVEHIQNLIKENGKPVRTIETPVCEYA